VDPIGSIDTGGVLELAFRPDRVRGAPLYRQLAGHVRTLVESGRLREGQKLPASRELASALGVSRNTVSLAYELLAEARLVRAHVGQGTFVTDAPPRGGAGRGDLAAGAAPGLAWEGLLAAPPPRLRGLEPETSGAPPIAVDLRGGRVDAATLPVTALRQAFGRALARLPELANRLDPQGYAPLRTAIAAGLVSRGLQADAQDVVVVSGAQEGLDLVARALLEAGDAVALEEPGWFGARLAFAARGARLVPVPVDAGGLRTDALARVLRGRRVKLVYATPAVQAPTGVALAEERRAELLALAAEHQCAIVEDDYDSELRLGGTLAPALARDDAGGRVILLGTFSKALFPALRVGYVVAPRPVVRRLVALAGVAHFGGSALVQAALAELLASGALERHVRRVRRLYAERLEAVLDAVARRFPAGTRAVRPAGGTCVWVELPPGIDAAALALAARERGLAVTSGDAFRLEPGGSPALQIGFAAAPAAALAEGVARLGALLPRAPEVPR
jgi:GntR family transcriptional regulator/MocR family aminotransferase